MSTSDVIPTILAGEIAGSLDPSPVIDPTRSAGRVRTYQEIAYLFTLRRAIPLQSDPSSVSVGIDAALAAWFVDDSTFYPHSVGIGLLPSFALALVAVVLAFTGRSGRAPVVAA